MPKSQGNFQNSLCLPPNLKKATLMTVISVGNTLQEGANFSYFVDLVKQEFEKGSLEKLIIVTTGHLQRHYFSLGLDKPLTEEEIEEKANAIDNKWLEENEIYLQQSKIHYKKKLGKRF